MALTILLTLILIGLCILVWCKWEERKWLDDEYVHLSKPKREFIEKQLAEARAAVDDKMPDDAIFHKCVPECKPNSHIATDKPKAMKAPIIPKGWKRHDGGKRPVRWHTMVDVLFGAGDQWDNSRAIDWEWESTGKVAQDIIAYRIVKPKKPKA